jgi:hypothetical protein
MVVVGGVGVITVDVDVDVDVDGEFGRTMTFDGRCVLFYYRFTAIIASNWHRFLVVYG